MTDIKPIETEYKGYKFRSRLEARWAVFFDKAGIPFEYEKEGFEDSDGTKYLPDFYLPWFKAYVEIKPLSFVDDQDAFNEAVRKLAMVFQAEDCVVILACGDPADDQMYIWCNEADDGGGGVYGGPCFFAEGVQGWDVEPSKTEWGYTKHWISIVVGKEKDRDREFKTSRWEDFGGIQRTHVTGWRNCFENDKLAARGARFEHRRPETLTRDAQENNVAERAAKTMMRLHEYCSTEAEQLVMRKECEKTIIADMARKYLDENKKRLAAKNPGLLTMLSRATEKEDFAIEYVKGFFGDEAINVQVSELANGDADFGEIVGTKGTSGRIIYCEDYNRVRDTLTQEQKGILLDALMDKKYDGDDMTVKAVFNIFLGGIERNEVKYAERCAKNAENARRRWAKAKTLAEAR